MKIPLFILALCLLKASFILNAQEYATDKGAFMITGLARFSSSSGKLYSDSNNNSLTKVAVNPSIRYFLLPQVYCGLNVDYERATQGRIKAEWLGFGPNFGMSPVLPTSQLLPYLGIGINFVKTYDKVPYLYDSYEYKGHGTDITMAAGIIYQLKDHLGLTIEATYHMISLDYTNEDPSGGNVLMIGIGIAGLLY